ncbi:MAG: maltose alpha-D-glucosyltransferase [Lautropia sp.]
MSGGRSTMPLQRGTAAIRGQAAGSRRVALDPLWYKDAIIYQLHVKTFLDSNGDGIGDFAGLTQRLPYVRDLGVDTIWLQPFYPSPLKDDGYDIADYHGVHPDYGSLADFKAFLRQAHRLGLKVITELVINHTSDQHPWFQAARRAPKGSMKRDYYVWSDDDRKWPQTRIIFTDTETSNWAWDPIAKAYYWHRFFSHQPDLNFDNPHVIKAVVKVMRYWFDMGVDGMRLDAIPYLCERDGTINENLPQTHEVLKRLRAELDSRYTDRFFLAEANQWPEDVREYFGDGDECHMAYHFPLMPRMYMAVAQEDRHPIVEIMAQTPDIPPTCQWAMFLRNHDELTLEMVTSEERDYMYRMYAADPRMRINVGIRRRLAPLLDNDMDRIRLMNSLLLSMPGSPTIYYGDEIGMGDNVYLGDRNGVRTPMQWNSDRNAGFATCDPQRLYLPPVMDPIYGYQAVNVEAQAREPSSLLNWMRRLLGVRRGTHAFGRGTLHFLKPGNRKVLAYVREYANPSDQPPGESVASEVILCVANLARTSQPVELDLAAWRGRVPVEMLGGAAFPPIGDLPYFVTLPGYGFYWFRLSDAQASPAWHQDVPAAEEQPLLVLPDGLRSLLPPADPPPTGENGRADATSAARRKQTADANERFETAILPQWLARQRWYAQGTRTVERASLERVASWHARSHEWILALAGADTHRYFLPLGTTLRAEGGAVAGLAAFGSIARARRQAHLGVVVDACADPRFALDVVDAMRASARVDGDDGSFVFESTPLLDGALAADATQVATIGPPTSSNTTIDIAERAFLKFYRNPERGPNLELEMNRHLTERAGFGNAVPVLGAMHFLSRSNKTTPLAILQRRVEHQGDGWAFTLEHLARTLLLPSLPDELHETYAVRIRTLGVRTREMHEALARGFGDPLFEPETASEADRTGWVTSILADAQAASIELADRIDTLDAALRDDAARAADALKSIAPALRRMAMQSPQVKRIRIHGDYHLGQVLLAADDFVIIDFEGEPSRPLAERRRKQNPLRDVAGMVRSFDYARAVSERRLREQLPQASEERAPMLRDWSRLARASFLDGYRAGAGDADLYGGEAADGAAFAAGLKLFMLEKVIYELRYEIGHRADWIGIPLAGLLEVLADA